MNAVSLALLGSALSAYAAGAVAAPVPAAPGEPPGYAFIALGTDPAPPDCVCNPGGTLRIFWSIDPQTTPHHVVYELWDPSQSLCLEYQSYPGSSGLVVTRQWTAPEGVVDGRFWVRVEYWSYEAGNETNVEVSFYVCSDGPSPATEASWGRVKSLFR
jgi:hypothetical protein